MSNDDLQLEERKKQLIAQGAAHRAEVILAREDIRASLNPELLAKGAIDHITTAAMHAFRNGHVAQVATAALPTLLPLLMKGVAALSKRSLLKPVLRGVAIASAAGAITMLILKMKRRRGNVKPPA